MELNLIPRLRFTLNVLACAAAVTLPLMAHAHGDATHATTSQTSPLQASATPGADKATHVAPGRSQRITWTFTEAGRYAIGCLTPSHWDASMKAAVDVRPAP